jgi:dynactin 1
VLKGHNLLQQMHALARLPKPVPKPAAAAVEVKVGEPVQRMPPRTVAPKASARAEASQVYSSALTALALSTVVDLTPLTRRVEGEEKRTRAWVPHDKQPRVQLEQHALTRARLVKQLAAASHRLSPHAVAT